MHVRPTHFGRPQRFLLLALPLALPLLASAQTVVTQNGTTTVVAGGPKRVASSVAIVAAMDTTGNADNAKAALAAARTALNDSPGYAPLPNAEYPALAANATTLKDVDWGYPFTSSDFQKIGKQLKVAQALTVSTTPDANGAISAVAEIYDTKSGGLTGHGVGTSGAMTGNDGVAVAVKMAVADLGRTATFNGIVITKPGGYLTRVSLGEQMGVRGGARVEYLRDGQPFAYGSIIDLGFGESIATVAPETAISEITVNTPVRVSLNPTARRALPTAAQTIDKDFARFERSFAVSAGVAAAVYYLVIN